MRAKRRSPPAPSPEKLVRLACGCSLIALLVMSVIVLFPIPLLVVAGIGVAHGIGIVGVLLFAWAVLSESSRPRNELGPNREPEAPQTSKNE